MHICLLAQFHNRAHLFVLRLVHHHERCRDVALFHRVDLLCHFGGQVLVFKPRAARVGVGHQARVHHGVLVLREMDDGLFEGVFAVAHCGGNGI